MSNTSTSSVRATNKHALSHAMSGAEGLIPELRFPEFINEGEWEENVLSNITDAIFDGTHQTPTYTESGIPFFSVENIVSGNKNKFISKEDYEIATNKNKPEKGDILITRIGKIGFSAIVDWNYEFSIYVTLACIKQSKHFNSYFLHSYFQSSTYQKEIFSKSLLNAVPCKINMNELRETKVLLPKPQEQQKIASCLSSLDELLAAHNEKLQALKDHKKGLMQNLFPYPSASSVPGKSGGERSRTPNYRFPEFKKDGEWVEKILGKICDVRDGTHDSPKYISDGFPMITSKNLSENGEMDFDKVSYITKEDYEKINQRSKVDIGDILFGMIGTIGNPVLVKRDGFAIKNVALIKSKGGLNQQYLLHLLKSDFIAEQFHKANAGGILKFIALGMIRKLVISTPSLKEQQKIASCLSAVDEIITAQTKKIEQLKQHKKGLMQGLFPKIEN